MKITRPSSPNPAQVTAAVISRGANGEEKVRLAHETLFRLFGNSQTVRWSTVFQQFGYSLRWRREDTMQALRLAALRFDDFTIGLTAVWRRS